MMNPFHRKIAATFTILSMLGMVIGLPTPSLLAASAPNIFTYQGRVLGSNSVPVSSSTISMKFWLYTASAAGTCVWSNSSSTCDANTPASTTGRTVALTNGLFTENLGDTSVGVVYAAIPDTVFADNGTIYLEVAIDGETLSPRRMITSAPYALNAHTLDGLSAAELGGPFETGVNGIYEDDAAVIVGADAAFSYGSGGVGDLRVTDELEVRGTGYFRGNLIIGAVTSAVETIDDVAFTMTGDDLFVADDVGIEGRLYIDDGIFGAFNRINTSSTLGITGATGLDLISTAGTLDISTGDASNITLTTGNANNLVNVLTGNLKVGNGVPTVTLDGGDAYIEGTLEVDGSVNFGSSTSMFGGLTFNSVLTDITSAAADPLTIQVGSANPGSGVVGGQLTLNAGSGDGAFDGGATSINGGTSGSGATGNGGAVTVTAGAAVSTSGDGGAASFLGGKAWGTAGSGGAVVIRGGEAVGPVGSAGSVTIDAGDPGVGTEANINLGTLYAAAVLVGTNLVTDSAGDNTLGSATAEWDGLYVGDDGVGVTFGADQDVSLSYVSADTALNLALTDGNTFKIDGDGTPTATILNIGNGDTFPAATTSSAMVVDLTAGAGDGLDIYSALTLNVTSADHTASTDETVGLNIANLASADAEGIESAIKIGTGWDVDLKFMSTTPVIEIPDGGTFFIDDSIGNSLFSISDVGSAGLLQGLSGITLSTSSVTLAALATTLSVSGKSHIRLTGDVGGNTVSVFSNSIDGQLISIVFADGNVTMDCSGNIKCGLTNITPNANDTMTFLRNGPDNQFDLISYVDVSATQTGTDVAEWFPATQTLEPGDVLVSSGTPVHVEKSVSGYQKGLIGVVATQPGLILGEEGQSTYSALVALAGRVPVNATNENGPIAIGDYLTSSATRPGYAMKATKVGNVIGVALENFNEATGQVMMHVNNSWTAGDVISSDGSSTILTDKVVMAPLGTATADQPSFDSYGFALRGSAWDGANAQAVEMMLQTSVTTGSDYRLSVRDTADSEVAYITNTGTMKLAGDLVIAGKIYPADRGTAQTSKYIYYDGAEGAGGDYMRTNAKGWSTGSYDFAEMFPSAETLLPGEIVTFAGTGENVKRSESANAKDIAGIVSTRPGFLAGDNKAGSFPIALAGRVPTRATTENGEIQVGDPLTTSSKPGYAMKAKKSGMIVGYALEPLTSGEKSILAYVNVGHWDVGANPVAPGTNNQASGLTGGSSVNYTALNMTGNIYVSGHEIMSVGRIAGISDVWSIEQDGTIKTETLLKTVIRSYTDEKVETIATTSPEAVITLTGTSKLSGGQAEVRFEAFAPSFNDVTAADAPLRVIVTPTGPVSLYVSEKDNNHFVVKQFAGEQIDVEFDWMVTAYRKGYEPKPLVSEPAVEVAPTPVGGEPVIEVTPNPEVIVPLVEEVLNPPIIEPVVSEEPATQESPEVLPIDPVTVDEGGVQAEQPSVSPIEPTITVDEETESVEISPAQEAITE